METISYAYSSASSYAFGSTNPTSTTTTTNTTTTTPSIPSSSTVNTVKRHHHYTASRREASNTLPLVGESPNASNPTSPPNGKRSIKVKHKLETSLIIKNEGMELCDYINSTHDLYLILSVPRKATTEIIRRAFLTKSRLIHPDKLPLYPSSTPAFQRLSFAYETLSKTASRRMYDLGGGRYDMSDTRSSTTAEADDETLNGVLRSVFAEFLEGDFEMIRVFVSNPGLNLGDEAVDSLEGAFRRVRESLLAGQKYLRLVKFELIRLYEIQHSLRSLGYLDLVGRMRLTLALTRVTLEIPMVLDKAMREEIVRVPRRDSKRSMDNDDGPNGEEEGVEDSDVDEGVDIDDIKTGDEDSNAIPRGTRSRSKSNRSRSRTSSSGTAYVPGMSDGSSVGGGELQRRGLLGPRVKGVLVLACKVLEKGERFGI